MIALSGAYNTESRGYQSVGVNPANLAFDRFVSFNLFNMNFNIKNNFLTSNRIRNINGANLEDANDNNYFPKEDILGYLKGENVHIATMGHFLIPMLNFSLNDFAINSQMNFISNSEFSPDIFDMVLSGNEINKEYNLDIKNNNILVWELAYTKSIAFNDFGIGLTIKYLKGLVYYSLEPIKNSYIQTNLTNINSQGRYLLRQNTNGQGFACDFGITTKRNKSGWKFGFSVINAFGSIRWNKKTKSDKLFSDLYNSLPYDDGESYLIDLSIDNLTLDALNNVNTNDIYSVDGQKVYEYANQPIEIESFFDNTSNDIEYYCSSEDCESYFVSSDFESDLAYMDYDVVSLDYPTIMSMGVSRQINKNKYILFDLSTGFDNSLGNLKKWRLAFGYIFGKQRFPFRLGMSYGGYDKKSFGFGWGVRLGKINFDVGIGLKGSIDIDKSNGLDLGFNMYWMKF
tara:strand:- start:13496 stop:14866 length:1371 start_codon:yes stop_codon:yes gene_type:complete